MAEQVVESEASRAQVHVKGGDDAWETEGRDYCCGSWRAVKAHEVQGAKEGK